VEPESVPGPHLGSRARATSTVTRRIDLRRAVVVPLHRSVCGLVPLNLAYVFAEVDGEGRSALLFVPSRQPPQGWFLRRARQIRAESPQRGPGAPSRS
jgi:hypothetical protein